MMRTTMIAAAVALGMASAAAAAEPPACYDAAVVGWMTGYANDRPMEYMPTAFHGVVPRVQADALVQSRSQIAGPKLPKAFWARTIVLTDPHPVDTMLIYLKTQPDGVPAVVGYRYAPPWYRQVQPTDYPAC
jgi:hypothetical protein